MLTNCQRPALYVMAGVLQWLIDTAVMMGLSHAGRDVVLATVCGRLAGAATGFIVNARITFAAPGARATSAALPRFLLFWTGTTVLSACLLGWIDRHAGLQVTWLAKPLVDLGMAVLGYAVSRYWIYRVR